MLWVHQPLSCHKILLVPPLALFVHKSPYSIHLNETIVLFQKRGMFPHRFMRLPWSCNVLLCVYVCVCMCTCVVSYSGPTSRLITQFFGFSLQQAARFQPVLACHLSPHSPLWPRTQPPIWGDSSSFLSLSHTHKQRHYLLFTHTSIRRHSLKHILRLCPVVPLKETEVLWMFWLVFLCPLTYHVLYFHAVCITSPVSQSVWSML